MSNLFNISLLSDGTCELFSIDKEHPDYEKFNEGKIKVPSEFKGHKILRIKNDAFEFTDVEILDLSHMIHLKCIQSSAFYSCGFLKEVILPESLSVIQSGAFAYCRKLKKIILPKNIEQIGYHAFFGCSSLKIIEGGNSYCKVNLHAFDGTQISDECLVKHFPFMENFEDN